MNKRSVKIILLIVTLVAMLTLGYTLIPRTIKDYMSVILIIMFFILSLFRGIILLLNWMGFDMSRFMPDNKRNKIIVVCSCGNNKKFTEIYGDDCDNEMRCDICGYQGVIDNVDEFECK